MRALLAIAAGVFLIALAFGAVPLPDDQPPIPLQIFMVVLGSLMILLAIFHLSFLWKRRAAYAGGRERKGTVKLLAPIGKESDSALIVFANRHSQWVMTAEIEAIRHVADDLAEGLPAKAYLGEDDRIYGLDIGQIKSVPISAGTPFRGELREGFEELKRRSTEGAKGG